MNIQTIRANPTRVMARELGKNGIKGIYKSDVISI